MVSQLLTYPSGLSIVQQPPLLPLFIEQQSWLTEAKRDVWNAKSTQHHSDVKPNALNVHESFCDQTESQFLLPLIRKGIKGGGWGSIQVERPCMSQHTLLERRLSTGLPPRINDLPVLSLKPSQRHNTSLIPSHTRVHFRYITERLKVYSHTQVLLNQMAASLNPQSTWE